MMVSKVSVSLENWGIDLRPVLRHTDIDIDKESLFLQFYDMISGKNFF